MHSFLTSVSGNRFSRTVQSWASVASWFNSCLEKHALPLRLGRQPNTSLRDLAEWLLGAGPISAELI